MKQSVDCNYLLYPPGPGLLDQGAHVVLELGVGGDQPEPVHPVQAHGEHLLGGHQAEALQLRLEKQTVRGAAEIDVGDQLEILSLK